MIEQRREEKPRALLVGIHWKRDESKKRAKRHVEELERLVDTMGGLAVCSEIVNIDKPHPKYFLGTGKLEEIVNTANNLECTTLVIDADLSPSQQRNLETAGGMPVMDRHEVILEIFSRHASTKEASLQVELATLQYTLPRLKRLWTHLSRQRGGYKGARGKGEKQIESDRRYIQNRITRIKREIERVRKYRSTQRKRRQESVIPTGAIVGYTNAGKSSLLNALSGSEIVVQNQLFATLDPTTREVELGDELPCLLTDTVGFIEKLPHDLIESFSSTLEEAAYADFLIHVMDISDEEVLNHAHITETVLNEIGAGDKPVIRVFNKIDLVESRMDFDILKNTYPEASFISIRTKEGINELEEKVRNFIAGRLEQIEADLPSARYDLISLIHRTGNVLDTKYSDNHVLLRAVVPKATKNKIHHYIVAPT